MCGNLQHIITSNPSLLMIESINAISIAWTEELKGALKRNTVYDLKQSVEVK